MICLHTNPPFKPKMERFYVLAVDTFHLMQKSVSLQV